MAWEQIICYKCIDCDKIYTILPKDGCTCLERKFYRGQRCGSFFIQDEELTSDGKYTVICILCGLTAKIHKTNLKRQVSCGCKPKHISIHSIDNESIVYACKRCNKIRKEIPPVVVYCCEEGFEGYTDEEGEENDVE